MPLAVQQLARGGLSPGSMASTHAARLPPSVRLAPVCLPPPAGVNDLGLKRLRRLSSLRCLNLDSRHFTGAGRGCQLRRYRAHTWPLGWEGVRGGKREVASGVFAAAPLAPAPRLVGVARLACLALAVPH